jgi:hypothetical protein
LPSERSGLEPVNFAMDFQERLGLWCDAKRDLRPCSTHRARRHGVCMGELQQPPSRLSLWASILTAVMAAVSLGMAITTLPRSGPYCQSGCVGYPYTDVAAFVPRDYLWMYPAVLLTMLTMVLVECIHNRTAPSRGLLSRIGVAFTTMGVAILVVDYASQLTFPSTGIAPR